MYTIVSLLTSGAAAAGFSAGCGLLHANILQANTVTAVAFERKGTLIFILLSFADPGNAAGPNYFVLKNFDKDNVSAQVS